MAIFSVPDAARILRLWDPNFMEVGSSVSSTTPATGEVQQQADYFEHMQSQSGTGGSSYSSTNASDFRARRLANGARPGIIFAYNNTGGVFQSLVGSVGSFTDSTLSPANFFGLGNNIVPDDLPVFNTELPAGTPYNSFPNGAQVARVWDYRWMQYLVAFYAKKLQSNSYFDGISPDVCGATFARAGSDGTNTHPWHPIAQAQVSTSSGTGWFKFWVASIAACLAFLQRSLGGSSVIPVIPNCIDDGYRYWGDPSSQIMAGTYGGWVELFLRNMNAGKSAWPAESDGTHAVANWQDCVDMMFDAANQGKVLPICTKLWPTSGVRPTTTESMQWMRLCLGTYLIGNNGLHLFHFRHDDTTGSMTIGNSTAVAGDFTADIGSGTWPVGLASSGATTFTATSASDASTQYSSAHIGWVVIAGGPAGSWGYVTSVPNNHQLNVTRWFGSQPGPGTTFIVCAEALFGVAGGLYQIDSVNSSQITLHTVPAGGDQGTISINWGTTNPMHGRHRQQTEQYFLTVPNFAAGVSSSANPDQANWYDRILATPNAPWNGLTGGQLKLGTPTDNYTLPISAQRQTGGGSAYYFRRFSAGLVIVNPTAVDVVGLNATAAPISAAASGTWNDIGAELNGNGRTSGSTLQTITSLYVPAHSALILVHT